MPSLADFFGQLRPDPLRSELPFRDEVARASAALYRAASDDVRANVLGQWLERHQPCLFGRIAAKLGLISYCFLTEADLVRSDRDIQDKIQHHRTAWTRDGYRGAKSAFVLLLVSDRVATALPSPTVAQLARRLCTLYLLDECEEDRILYDDIFLEKPGDARVTWKWKTGVNYFCAQGDGRWWADHRIPGGMAFSVNSVGHMVKSGRLKEHMEKLNVELGVSDEDWNASRVDSLPKALVLAMKTIANAADTVSGKATELLPEQPVDSQIKCPVELTPDLRGKSHCEYRGHYHTDYTIPAEYFLPDVPRPAAIRDHRLDFTYLFHDDAGNPPHVTMGKGQRTRGDPSGDRQRRPEFESSDGAAPRASKAAPEEVLVERSGRLLAALQHRPSPGSG